MKRLTNNLLLGFLFINFFALGQDVIKTSFPLAEEGILGNMVRYNVKAKSNKVGISSSMDIFTTYLTPKEAKFYENRIEFTKVIGNKFIILKKDLSSDNLALIYYNEDLSEIWNKKLPEDFKFSKKGKGMAVIPIYYELIEFENKTYLIQYEDNLSSFVKNEDYDKSVFNIYNIELNSGELRLIQNINDHIFRYKKSMNNRFILLTLTNDNGNNYSIIDLSDRSIKYYNLSLPYDVYITNNGDVISTSQEKNLLRIYYNSKKNTKEYSLKVPEPSIKDNLEKCMFTTNVFEEDNNLYLTYIYNSRIYSLGKKDQGTLFGILKLDFNSDSLVTKVFEAQEYNSFYREYWKGKVSKTSDKANVETVYIKNNSLYAIFFPESIERSGDKDYAFYHPPLVIEYDLKTGEYINKYLIDRSPNKAPRFGFASYPNGGSALSFNYKIYNHKLYLVSRKYDYSNYNDNTMEVTSFDFNTNKIEHSDLVNYDVDTTPSFALSFFLENRIVYLIKPKRNKGDEAELVSVEIPELK